MKGWGSSLSPFLPSCLDFGFSLAGHRKLQPGGFGQMSSFPIESLEWAAGMQWKAHHRRSADTPLPGFILVRGIFPLCIMLDSSSPHLPVPILLPSWSLLQQGDHADGRHCPGKDTFSLTLGCTARRDALHTRMCSWRLRAQERNAKPIS